MTALDEQVGGSHYRDMAIQPWVFNELNNIGATERHIIEYVCRWRSKGGIKDLRKIQHYCQLMIEHEENLQAVKASSVCESCFDKHLVAKTFGYEFMKCVCKCHSESLGKVNHSRIFPWCGDCFHMSVETKSTVCKCDCHKETKDAG